MFRTSKLFMILETAYDNPTDKKLCLAYNRHVKFENTSLFKLIDKEGAQIKSFSG